MQEKDDDAEDDGSALIFLLDEMRPYVLRRVKAHVENPSRPKKKLWVSVALAPRSKRGTTELSMKKTSSCSRARAGRSMARSLMNLAMELRKCCNHPFLLKGVGGRKRRDCRARRSANDW